MLEQGHKRKIRLLTISLAVGIMLTGVKFYAFFVTHSNAIFTDALESIANITAGGVALFSIIRSAKPRDTDHPYGHGKIEFLSSGFEAMLIMLAGVVILVKAITGFMDSQPLEALDMGIGLTAGAGAINFGLGWYLAQEGKKRHSPTLVADGKHLMTDGYSSAGLVAGLLTIYFTHLPWLDGLLAVALGGLILWTGWGVLRHAISGVMDEADLQLVGEVIAVLGQHRRDCWIDAHNLRIIKYGPQLHIDCHVTLPWYFSVREAHEEIKAIETTMNQAMENRVEIFVHTDPCVPESCSVCALANCPVREAAFKKRMDWTLENVIQDRKHTA
jgi:cation diffusion facilitator family transporter